MFDAKHWRARAEEARVHAEQIDDRLARETMLKIAEDYEKLAQRADARDAARDPTTLKNFATIELSQIKAVRQSGIV